MKIIYFGDIVGRAGRVAVLNALDEIRARFAPDVMIANGDLGQAGQQGGRDPLVRGITGAEIREVHGLGPRLGPQPAGEGGEFLTPVERAVDEMAPAALDAPGGGGKVPVNPDYVLSRNADRVVLRNFEGKVFEYIEGADGKPRFKPSENFHVPEMV